MNNGYNYLPTYKINFFYFSQSYNAALKSITQKIVWPPKKNDWILRHKLRKMVFWLADLRYKVSEVNWFLMNYFSILFAGTLLLIMPNTREPTWYKCLSIWKLYSCFHRWANNEQNDNLRIKNWWKFFV